jgi:hypothetical protein
MRRSTPVGPTSPRRHEARHEIILKVLRGEFLPADGLYFLDRELGLGLDRGPTLWRGHKAICLW